MKVTLSVNRVLVTVVLLLSIPLFFDLTKLPSSADAQEYVFAALTPCDGLRICNLCGEVLEMVDLVQRALVDPFTDELTLSAADWDPHSLHSYQRCLREPIQRGCDTLVHKVKTQRMEFAKLILEQILEDVNFQHKWGLLGEDYIVSNAMRLSNYIFEAQERTLGGRRDPRKEESAARSIVYQHSTLSLSSDPEVETLVSRVWFLRRDVQRLHQDFCYPVCEAKLSVFGRLRLALARFYIHHSIKPRLLLLRQHHRGTLMVVELMMISVAVCVERLMRPAQQQWNGVVLATADGRRLPNGAEFGNGGGGGSGVYGAAPPGNGVRGNDGVNLGGSGVTHTTSSASAALGTTGGGKGHSRQGRRR